MVIIAGPNGSGKTTTTEKLLQHEWSNGVEYINPDIVAQEFGDWNDDTIVSRAREWSTSRREELLATSQSMIFETVFSAPDKLDFVVRAKQQGYFVRLFFIGTIDPEINIRRVLARVSVGGHQVPDNKVRKRYVGSIGQLYAALSLVDRAYLFDNSIDGEPAALYARTQDSQLRKRYGQPPLWVELAIQDLPRHPEFEQLP